MPGIVINANFDLKQNVPLDSRLVVSGATAREDILYKYEGMRVYQMNEKKTYLWDGITWSIDASYGGIYGGSGSLVGDTLVYLGTQSGAGVGSDSYDFTLFSTSPARSLFTTKFYRHTSGLGNFSGLGVELRQQLTTDGVNANCYIGYNTQNPNSTFGDITVNSGSIGSVFEVIRMTNTGKFGVRTNDPKEIFQVSGGQSQPLVIHKGGSTVIGYNWYFNNTDVAFNSAVGSSKILQSNGEVGFYNRQANQPATSFVSSLFLSPQAQVGIGTELPTNKLHIIGNTRMEGNVFCTGVLTASIETHTNITWAPYHRFPGNNFGAVGGVGTGFIIADLSPGGGSNMIIFNSDLTQGAPNYNASFSTHMYVAGNTNIVKNLTVTQGNIRVLGTGSIINDERPTTLTPIPLFSPGYNLFSVSVNGKFSGSQTYAGGVPIVTYPASGFFTYSFFFTRIGNMVNMDFTLKATQPFDRKTMQTFGILCKFGYDDRFKPRSYSVGFCMGSIDEGRGLFPMGCQIWSSTGNYNSLLYPALGQQEWFFKINTFNGSSELGEDFAGWQNGDLPYDPRNSPPPPAGGGNNSKSNRGRDFSYQPWQNGGANIAPDEADDFMVKGSIMYVASDGWSPIPNLEFRDTPIEV